MHIFHFAYSAEVNGRVLFVSVVYNMSARLVASVSVGKNPHQPSPFNFPEREFGKKSI